VIEQQVESFAEASGVEAVGEGRFVARVPDGWQQGRGAFGGLSIGIGVRALEAVEQERPVRALTAELPGPLMVGGADVRVTTLRRGRGMSTLEAHVEQDGEVKARVSAVLGGARVDEPGFAPEPPALGDWREVPAIPEGAVPPPFARFFEYRVTGPAPFTGGPEPVAAGWIRPKAALERWGPAEVVAMADAYWPAMFATVTAPRPMATVTFTLQLTERALALEPGAPLFYRARGTAASAGYVSELRELWTADGELVALNPQTFVIIR
jgi:hypothetical protein